LHGCTFLPEALTVVGGNHRHMTRAVCLQELATLIPVFRPGNWDRMRGI